MRHILTTERFHGVTDVGHTVNVYDSLLSELPQPSPVVVTLESPGYELNYNANLTNIMLPGIIESNASIYIRNLEGEMDSFLESLKSAEENRYVVEIGREYQTATKYPKTIWRGVLLQDFGSEEDKPYSAVHFVATDGIGILEGVEIENLDPNNRNSFLEYLIAGLSHIPSVEGFASADPFLLVKTDWYTDEMEVGKEPLEVVALQDTHEHWLWKFGWLWETKRSKEGYIGGEQIESEMMSYKDVINHIITRFNAVLLMSEGRWIITQRDLLADGDNITFHAFTKSAGSITSITQPTHYIADQDNIYRSDGEFYGLPALRKARVTYIMDTEHGDYYGLIPYVNVVDNPYTTYKVYAGAYNYLHIHVLMRTDYQVNIPITTPYKIFGIWTLDVQIGAYYLEFDAVDGYRWTTTPSSIFIKTLGAVHCGFTLTGTAYQDLSPRDWMVVYADFVTPGLPVDGEVTVELKFFDFESVPPFALSSAYTYTLSPGDLVLQNIHPNLGQVTMFYIYDNEQPIKNVTFQAENDDDSHSLTAVLEDSLFGSEGHPSKSLLHTYNGTDWKMCVGNNRFWEKGSATTPRDKFLNQLLVDEILSMQSTPLAMYAGTVIDRKADTLLRPLQLLHLTRTYAGMEYTLKLTPNNITYTPTEESWSGDWIEINRIKHRKALPSEGDELRPFESEEFQWLMRKDVQDNARETQRLAQIDDIVDLGTGEILVPTWHLQSSLFTVVMGFHYNWHSAAANIAAEGWKVPTAQDFTDLITFLGDEAGGKLKEDTLDWWDAPNEGATNETGFTGRGMGYIDSGGNNEGAKTTAQFWTAEFDEESSLGYTMVLSYDSAAATSSSAAKTIGSSLRLLKDGETTLADGEEGIYEGNDGKKYKTICIGAQEWMAENLCETQYRDGEDVTFVTTAALNDLSTEGACVVANDNDNAFVDDVEEFEVSSETRVEMEGHGGVDIESFTTEEGKIIIRFTAQKDVLDAIGDRQYTEENVVVSGETITLSINKLDAAPRITDVQQEGTVISFFNEKSEVSTTIDLDDLPRLKSVEVQDEEGRIKFFTENTDAPQYVNFSQLDHNRLGNYQGDRHRQLNYEQALKAYLINN